MKRNKTIMTTILLFGFLILIFFSLQILNKYETQELKMDVIIGNYTGINIDTDAIHFGTIEKGKSAPRTREVVIANVNNKSRKVYLTKSGELSKWIVLSESNFILSSHENKTIQVTLKINPETDYGNYNGTLRAVFKRCGG